MTEKRWLYLILIVCLSSTLFLRFTELGRMVIWHDEVFSLARIFGISHGKLIDAIHDGQIHTPAELLRMQQPQPGNGLSETLQALEEHPEHSPLYYLIGWGVARWVDEPIVALRGASAVLGLLLFPAIYWLGRELVGRRFAWLSVALASVSPVYFLYAREARQYALWIALMAAASAALLALLRRRNLRYFLIYTLLLILALYTHLITAMMMISHALFIFGLHHRRRGELLQAAKWVIPAWGFALLAFTPWLNVIVEQREAFQTFTGWMKTETMLDNLVASWLGTLTHLVIDLPMEGALASAIVLTALVVSIQSMRHAPRELQIFTGSLILVPLLLIVLPDLLQGGRRSMEPRYLLPLLLSLGLILAWGFTSGLSSLKQSTRRISGLMLCVLLVGGLGSQGVIAYADSWWTKSFSAENVAFARLVNRANKPLIIGSSTAVSGGEIVSLAHRLAPHVRILMENPATPLTVPVGYAEIFTFMPSDGIRQQLEKHYRLESYVNSWKWSIAVPLGGERQHHPLDCFDHQ